jgi:hypothetical protein
MSLWGMQDVVAQHKRRYLIREVVRRMDQAGLHPIRSFYFNFLLFVPIWAMRQLLKLLRVKLGSENEINTSWINAMLTAVMALDVRLAPVVHPPFGVSALVLARKRAS